MNLNRRTIVIFVSILLILFYGFSREVKKGKFKNIDFTVTVKIQDRMPSSASGRIDEFWEDIGFFASPMVSTVFVMALTVWSFIKARGFKRKIAVLLIPLAFGLLTLAEVYGNSVVHHPAPPFFMLKNPTTIFPKYYVNEQYSYPSGHAGRAVFVAILASSVMLHASSKNKRKKQIIILVALAYVVLVSLGKIYLGQHWFSDVVGGFFIGTAVGIPIFGLLYEF